MQTTTSFIFRDCILHVFLYDRTKGIIAAGPGPVSSWPHRIVGEVPAKIVLVVLCNFLQ